MFKLKISFSRRLEKSQNWTSELLSDFEFRMCEHLFIHNETEDMLLINSLIGY